MLDRFKNFMTNELHIPANTKVLVAVSGGIDSMVLAYLFKQSDYEFGIAHCNYQLRGAESDGDETHVREFAGKNYIPFFTKRFDTKAVANENGWSTQMAARELRYKWFEEIREKNGYDLIAVAHHRDDSVETFLLNLIRGTGIAGVQGIKVRYNKVIRPLLFTDKEEITHYSIVKKIAYREDQSNTSLMYKRNRIRHQVIPILKELNPSLIDTILQNTAYLTNVERVYLNEIERQKEQLLHVKGDEIYISIEGLKVLNPAEAYLYEFIKPFGFKKVDDIIRNLDGESGKQFFSDTHRLIKDRNELIISPISENDAEIEFFIQKEDEKIEKPAQLKFKTLPIENFELKKSKNLAALDFDKIEFPLTLRKWQKGDYFFPLGMKGKKKLSDFFTDQKLSLLEKENAWILCSGSEIIWVVNQRLDDRFKVTDNTKKVYLVELIETYGN